jgi:hypothetical protein
MEGVKHHPIALAVVSTIVAAPIIAGAFVNHAAVLVVEPQPSASVPSGWQEFTSQDGGFSIAGPGPGYESPIQTADDGTHYKQVTILGTHDGSFIVYWTDYDESAFIDASPDDLLADALDNYVGDTPGASTPGAVQAIGPMRCRDLILRPTSIVDRVRFCIWERRLFQIVARFYAGSGEAKAERFIESFRLTGR